MKKKIIKIIRNLTRLSPVPVVESLVSMLPVECPTQQKRQLVENNFGVFVLNRTGMNECKDVSS